MFDWRILWPGYLLISVKGSGLARFLNLATRQGINFWDLGYEGSLAVLKIRPRDFKRLRPLLRKTGCSVRILQKKGAPFLLLQGKRRKGLALGMAFFCFMLYFFSLFIWHINIEGNTDVSKEEIRAVLENNGVKEGIFKKRIDLTELERALLLKIADLKWAGAGIKGVFLNIQVVERLREPPLEEEPRNLVAAKDGLVTDILVLSGEPLVEIGDTVQKGQKLISGQVKIIEELEDGEQLEEIMEVKPKGMVQALVWYESYTEVPLYQVRKKRTGNAARFFSLEVEDRRYNLWGPASSPYRNYEMEKTKHFYVWRDLRLPVELSIIGYRELEVDIQPVSPQAALQEAKNLALEELNLQLPKGATIKERYVNEFYFFELGRVGCRVMIETLEDIAV